MHICGAHVDSSNTIKNRNAHSKYIEFILYGNILQFCDYKNNVTEHENAIHFQKELVYVRFKKALNQFRDIK